MKKFIHTFIAYTLILCTVGCATGYRDFYKPVSGFDASQIASIRATPPHENPIVERVGQTESNLIADAYLQRGYLAIGTSFFNSSRNESDASAIQMAKDVKADLVLIINPKFTGSTTTSVPIVTPTTSTTYSNSTATAYGSGGYATAYGSGVATTYGSATSYIPVTINRNDYGAVYFIKPKIALGIVPRDLTDDERRIAKTNMGAIVRIIINNTPAFYSDVLVGDRLVEIDGISIKNSQSYSQIANEKKGREILLKILRNDQLIEKKIKLFD